MAAIARGLFSALRGLDDLGCTVILIEGVDCVGTGRADADGDGDGDGKAEGKAGGEGDESGMLAAAVMNRLRKACE
jgi:Putative GTP-binding controlling metal-binding